MDYEKKYKESLERAKSKINNDKDHVLYEEDIVELFPELAESEDEKIRKDIVFFIAANHKDDGEKARWLYWLDKQGEQKVIIPKFRVGDTIHVKNSSAEYIITDISNGMYHGKGWGLDIVAADKSGDWELVEQKSAEWSEKDDVMLDEIIDFFENGTVKLQHDLSLYASWLKSLTQKLSNIERTGKNWKPSEEQIITLCNVIDTHVREHERNQENAHTYMVLKELKEQLLKL